MEYLSNKIHFQKNVIMEFENFLFFFLKFENIVLSKILDNSHSLKR